jgi:hypothetical protein
MDVSRYFERLKTMDELIRRKSTGNPEEFAKRLGISRSTLMDYIKLLKSMSAPVEYDGIRMSYYYVFPCTLKIGYEYKFLSEDSLSRINKKSLEKFCEIITVRK